MIVHSVCTMCSLIPYYHPHGIAFCLYNMFTYSILPSTWYCILLQRVHLFHITIHMILHSVCTTCSLIPYYHPHDIAFCVYNVFTYSILPSTWYCILCVQRVHLFHITIHMIRVHLFHITIMILHSVQRVHLFHITIHMIFCVHSVPLYCILFVRVHWFHITIHMILHSVCTCHLFHIKIHTILHSVCTTCSLIPYYHPHDIAFCVYNVSTYSILPSTW